MYNLSLPIYVLFYRHVWTDCAERVLSTMSSRSLLSVTVCALVLCSSALVLYCTVPFIATCVDTIGTVFWDRPVLRYPGKALILVAKLLLFTLADTQVFRWFKFTLKPPNRITHDKLRLAIWDTSFWTFWLKFGHNGP